MGSYYIISMLPPHGAVGLIVYKGNPKLAKKQNYAGQIEMVETAHLFAWGKSFPKLQSNMSNTDQDWSNLSATLEDVPKQNAAELRNTVIRWGISTISMVQERIPQNRSILRG